MLEKIKKLLKLYEANRISLCTFITYITGPKGEGLYSISEFDNETIEKLVELSENFRLNNLACLDNYLILLSELGDKYPLLALANIARKIGVKVGKNYLVKFSKAGYLDPPRGLREILNTAEEYTDSTLGSLLLLLMDVVPEELLKILVQQLQTRNTDLANTFLDVYKTYRAEDKAAMKIIKSILLKLVKCVREKSGSCLHRQLLLFQASVNRFGKETVIRTFENLLIEVDGEDLFRRVLNLAVSGPIDSLETHSLITFMETFPEKLDFLTVLNTVEKILRERLYDNLDVVADTVLRTKNLDEKYLIKRSMRSKRLGDVLIRDFYATLLAKFVEEGKTWAINPLRTFCKDKRSAIRAKCANTIISYIEENNVVNVDLFKAIIYSRNTKALVRLLNFINESDVENSLLENVLKATSKVPRISVASSILEILEKKWDKISKKTLLNVIKRIFYISLRHKNLHSKVISFIKYLSSKDEELSSQLSSILKHVEKDVNLDF